MAEFNIASNCIASIDIDVVYNDVVNSLKIKTYFYLYWFFLYERQINAGRCFLNWFVIYINAQLIEGRHNF